MKAWLGALRTETLTRPDTLVPARVMYERVVTAGGKKSSERTEWLLDCEAKRR
jgi:hypothetical protein